MNEGAIGRAKVALALVAGAAIARRGLAGEDLLSLKVSARERG